jgi:hypothetical protein
MRTVGPWPNPRPKPSPTTVDSLQTRLDLDGANLHHMSALSLNALLALY